MATVETANSNGEYTSHPALSGNGSSLGGLLRSARERRGLTLQEIARETKLPQRHLEALEQGNLAFLPAGFYQRAEIRAYARAVGLDQTVLLHEIPKTPRPRLRRAYTVTMLAVVTLALLGYATSERTRTPNPTLHPEQSEPVAPLSTPSKSTLGVSIERTDAVAASDVSVGVSTETAEPRQSADSVTELVVTTEPAGARVTVNGIAWGVSPVTIPRLPPGDKRIRVTKEGYDSQERVLRLDEGQRRALDIPLEDTP
jgi:transcriptional regulator with XRE-family HTH domain